MKKITLFLLSLTAIVTCSTRKNSFIPEKETLIFKEIKARDSLLDIGGPNDYKLIILFNKNKVRYIIGKNSDCSSLNGKIDLKSNLKFKDDSVFFYLKHKFNNGSIINYKFDCKIRNDSLIANRYIKDDYLNTYTFIETLVLKKCN